MKNEKNFFYFIISSGPTKNKMFVGTIWRIGYDWEMIIDNCIANTEEACLKQLLFLALTKGWLSAGQVYTDLVVIKGDDKMIEDYWDKDLDDLTPEEQTLVIEAMTEGCRSFYDLETWCQELGNSYYGDTDKPGNGWGIHMLRLSL